MKMLHKLVRKFLSLKGIVSTTILLLSLSTISNAQVSVTFKVNLKPQLKDSVFVPGRDRLYLKGNVFPLTSNKKIYLEDTTPVDSVFQAIVDFPASSKGQKLAFNYFIYTPDKTKKEQMPRYLKLRREDIELDAIYFNSFAW